MQTEGFADADFYPGMLLCRQIDQLGNALSRVTAGSQEVRVHHDRLGAGSDAARNPGGHGRLCQFHVGDFDDLPRNSPTQRLGYLGQLSICVGTSTAVVNQQDGSQTLSSIYQ